AQNAADFFGKLKVASLIWTNEQFGQRERAGAESVLALLDSGEYFLNPGPVLGMLLQPVHEEHRIPVDEAHSYSFRPDGAASSPLKFSLSLWMKVSPPPRRRNMSLPFPKSSQRGLRGLVPALSSPSNS